MNLFENHNSRLVYLVVSSFFYILSPFDLIPEMVFGVIGFIDDMAIIILVVIATAGVMMTMMRERNDE